MERSFQQNVHLISKLRKLFLLLFLGLLTVALSARPVAEDEARIVALNWINSNGNSYLTSADIAEVIIAANNETPLLYTVVFKPSGWVIVSASDNMEPVLAWSNNSRFPINNKPVQMEGWLNALESGMKNVIEDDIQPDAEVQQKWQYYRESVLPPSQLKSTSTAVGPLLSSSWDQGRYYNEMCPADPISSTGNGHVWLGCVATAMAQVMKYWEYPYSGMGSHSFVHPDYGELSADFENATYIWSSMPNNPSSQNTEIQEIGYHCAVAANMDFGPFSSGAWLEDAAPAFVDYFKYNSTNYISDRDRWAGAEWEALLKQELDNSRPIVYSGYNASQSSGHAWVCDGYSGSYFHFNWGWSGEGNGNYLLNDLTPLSRNFSYFQSAILSIEPVNPAGISLPYQQGFETASVSPISLMGVYSITSEEKHTGSQSLRLSKPAINSSAVSALSLCFTVPNDAELNFWVKRLTPEVSGNNQQKVLIMPRYGGTPLAEVFNGDYNDENWVNYSVDLSAYSGQDIRILFLQEVDDYLKKQWMYIDDISITGIYVNLPPYTPENPIPVNGGAGISLSPVFSWAGGDPNGDDLTYEVYLGTENPPDLVGSVFDNNFTAQNLQHSTIHYWKIVATDGELTSESPVWSFTTTGIPPQMSICGLSNLSSTSVTICGEVVNDNGANIISRGICYNTEPNPATNNTITYPQFNNDIYSCELTGLTPYKHYYYRAFAMSNEGTGYSSQGEFTTMPGLPVVVAGGIENIFRTTASVNGEITHIYDESILERGVVWSVNEGFDVGSANRVSESGNWNMPGNFNFNLGGLPGPARIFFRIFAVNTAGTAYSSEASFETTNTPPFIDLDGDNSSGIQGNDYRGIYTEQLEGGRITDVDILLYDIDNDPIQGLTVTLLNQVHDNEEYLVVEGEFENITVIGNQTDNLAITASGPVNNDEWKTILRAIELRNIHDAPAPEEERQVRVSVNDGYDESALAMAFMNVIPVNDEPVCIAIPSQNRAPVAGETVSVIPGTWDDALDECTGGFEVSYQWQYQDGLGTAFDIEGETNIDLFLNENLCGKSVRVTEIITDSDCGGENIVIARAESQWAEVVRTSQVIVFDPLPVHYMHEKAFPFEGSSSSGLPVEYNSVNENILKVSGDTAYLMAAGRVIVSCFQPGNMCYLPSAKIDRLATIAKGNQQVENYSDLNLSYPDRQVILPAKASSGLPLTALSSDTLIVSTLKDTLILNKTGLVDLQLFQPGNANYHPSDTVVVSVVVDKGQQVITANYPPMSYGEGPYPIDVFSSSGLPVKLECLENEKLEYPADSFIVLGTGDVTITATQEGNELWYPAEPDVQTISIQKGNQIIAFEPIGEKRFNDPVFFAEATVNSGLEILFVISDTTIATINNGIVQIKDVGVTQVQAYNNGNELWEPVSAQQQLEILAAEQLISAGLFDTLTFGDLPFMIDFSATSGLEVLIGIEDEEVAKFNGDKFEVQNAGETNVILSQPGNEQWNPAEPLSRTLVVKKATQTLYSELPDTIENHGQKIFAAVFASSGLPVDLLTEDEQLAGLAGDSIEIRSHGELMLTAIQAGNKNYEPVQGQFRIVINQPVLIDEMEATEFYVYPNPASSYLMVKTGSFQPLPCDAKLINMLGETVMVLTLNNRINSISIDKLASGIYILQIEGHNSVLRKKFVVQN